jgi:MFS transporter, PAT family, beta-lactamase induction signal transducer AmpG
MGAFVEAFRSKRVAIFIAFGFAAGLPLQMRGPTLAAWLKNSDINIKTITLFTAAGLFYTFKFLWAPLLDRYRLPWLGRRRGWMMVMQLGLVASIGAMGTVDPGSALGMLALLAAVATFCSATQDIAIDAYKVELLHTNERASGSATYTMGYRLATIIAGGLALVLSDHMSWSNIYLLMAGLMAVGLIASWLGPEPQTVAPPRTLGDAVVKPLKDLLWRPSAGFALAFIMLYKFGDYLAADITTVFLIDRGFSNSEIGYVLKWFGMVATILGVLLGGGLVPKLGLRRSLLIFGVLQAVMNTGYLALAVLGKSHLLLIAAVAADWFIGGISTAAFAAYQMSICNRRFSATQFALIASASTVIGRLTGIWSGHVITAVGWPVFFILTIVVAIPGLLLVVLAPLERAVPAPESEKPQPSGPVSGGAAPGAGPG